MRTSRRTQRRGATLGLRAALECMEVEAEIVRGCYGPGTFVLSSQLGAARELARYCAAAP